LNARTVSYSWGPSSESELAPNGRGRVLAPDPGGRLSEGALVEASVHARLLGMPLLKVNALVALLPAALTPNAQPIRQIRSPRFEQKQVSRSHSSEPAGSDLAEAIRSINEAAELLAEEKRNRSREWTSR
jgi:hypothetical protein